MAQKQGWSYDPETTRGGRQKRFLFDLLPSDVKAAYTAWLAGRGPSVRPEVSKGEASNLPALVEAALAPALAATRTWETLPATCRDRAADRLAAVNELRAALAANGSGKTAIINRVARARGISPNTLRNWLAAADRATSGAGANAVSAQALALAPAWGKTRGLIRAFEPEALEWALALYLNPARINLTEVYRHLQSEARLRGWQVGSYDALLRHVERHIDPAVLCAGREGMAKAEARYVHKLRRNYDEIWSNFMWVADHHVLDVHVLDPAGRIVRPWVSAWMDMRSRSLVGWEFAFVPSSKTVARALRHAMLPKADPENFPQRGLPLVVYLDNGKDMRCDYLQGRPAEKLDYPADMERFRALGIDPFYIDMRYDPAERAWVKRRGTETLQVKGIRVGGVFTRLGVSPRYATAYHPWAKPIERMFRELVQNFSRLQPGWCGTKPEQRPEKWAGEIKSGRLLTLDKLADRWEQFVVHEYNGRPHGALGGATPTEAWLANLHGQVNEVGPALLDFALLKQARVKVYNWGFNLFGERFELAIGGSLADAALLNRLVGRYVDVHHDFELKVLRLYHEGDYVCDGRPLRLASFLDQSGEINQEKLRLAANQRKVIRARLGELRRAPLCQSPDAYVNALGSLALPEPAQPEEPVRSEVSPPPARPIYLDDGARYEALLKAKAQGEPLAPSDADFMADYEQTADYHDFAELYEAKSREYAKGGAH